MSTTITVPLQIARDLEGAGFPPHPVTTVAPEVNPRNYGEAAESIVIQSRTFDEDAVVEWASMGGLGRDERYIVDVIVTTRVPGLTWVAMMERLDDLKNAVVAIYTDDKAQFVPPGGGDGDTNPYRIWTGMATVERTNEWADDEGWYGQCRVALRIAARI